MEVQSLLPSPRIEFSAYLYRLVQAHERRFRRMDNRVLSMKLKFEGTTTKLATPSIANSGMTIQCGESC